MLKKFLSLTLCLALILGLGAALAESGTYTGEAEGFKAGNRVAEFRFGKC